MMTSAGTARSPIRRPAVFAVLALAVPILLVGQPGVAHAKPDDRAADRAHEAKERQESRDDRRAAPRGENRRRSEQDRERSQQRSPEDPSGNNGTVKVDGIPFDDDPANEPHPGCVFQIDFFGFDANDVADWRLELHAPTSGGLLMTGTLQLQDDPAAGGRDFDGSVTVDPAEELAASGVEPHPVHGFHVKLAVDIRDAPGGAKQKVFWLDCAPEAAAASAQGAAAGAGFLRAAAPPNVAAPQSAAAPSAARQPAVAGARFARGAAPARESRSVLAVTGTALGMVLLAGIALAAGTVIAKRGRRISSLDARG